MKKYDLTIPFPWKIIVSGYKQRRCGRWFLYNKKRWNLVIDLCPESSNLRAGFELVRDIRKTKQAKEILPKEYWRYLNK